jgi:hypothetical protein
MELVELGFHGPRRTALNEIAQTVITVCDNTHDGISLHALLQKEAVEERRGSSLRTTAVPGSGQNRGLCGDREKLLVGPLNNTRAVLSHLAK